MRYLGDLISVSRYDSNNVNYTTTTAGNPDLLFEQYANDAQDHLQAVLVNVNSQNFVDQEIITVVSGTETYNAPANLYINNKLISVEFSYTGELSDYVKLLPKTFAERNTTSGCPDYYIRAGRVIYLNPIPNQGGYLRVMYYRELDDIRLRNGTINGTPSGTSIVLSSPTSLQETNLSSAEYICVSDRFGTVMLYNGVVSSYNSGTDTITLAANVSTYLVSGYTLANLASGYVTIGAYSTTHSKLPNDCERYLITYMTKRGFGKDSSTNVAQTDQELVLMENDIAENHAVPTEDVYTIPILDDQILY